jgi:PAS domain S-box-containing protein
MALAPQTHPSTGPPSTTALAGTEDRLRLLIQTGLALSSERNLKVIVQTALEAGLRICGASFGAFFYNDSDSNGEVFPTYTAAAADPSLLASPQPPVPQETFPAAFPAAARPVHLFDDLMRPGSSGTAPPPNELLNSFPGLRSGHACVRSLLTVVVRGPGDEMLGGMLYGDPAVRAFDTGCQELITTIASQAAVAMENARLAATLSREVALADIARALQRDTACRLAQVFEAISDGVVLVDRNWRFTYLNRRATEILGRGANRGHNLAGQHLLDIFPDVAGSPFQQHYAEAMNEGRTVEFTGYYAPLDIWADIRVVPTADGIAIFFQDITQQRRAEQAISDSSRRLRQALDAAELGTWSWDRASDLLDLDQRTAALLHVEPHARVTRSALREHIVLADDRPSALRNLQRSLESGGLYSAEYRVDAPPGQVTWISSSGIATFSPGSTEITGMVGTVQDITTRKNSEAALLQGEKLAATGRLAATIAHEINNPLEAVTNLIYLAKTDPEVPNEARILLETADDELARVAQIAQQTLDFYRDHGRPVEIDLNDLLERCVDLFARHMQSRRIDCSLDLAPGLRIVARAGEIRQVVSNLLVNAMDASSSSGVIRIRGRRRVRSGCDGVCLLVCDHGSGIPEHARERLFSPFFTTKEAMGTGLGLSVTRGIIEKQNGRIAFRSRTKVPSGTVFRIFLPAAVATAAS